jgi:hypothetical protein
MRRKRKVDLKNRQYQNTSIKDQQTKSNYHVLRSLFIQPTDSEFPEVVYDAQTGLNIEQSKQLTQTQKN